MRGQLERGRVGGMGGSGEVFTRRRLGKGYVELW